MRTRIEDLASRYFDHALSAAEEGELMALLQESREARALFRELASIEGATAVLVSSGALGRLPQPRWPWWLAGSAAAAAALVLLALPWLHGSREHESPVIAQCATDDVCTLADGTALLLHPGVAVPVLARLHAGPRNDAPLELTWTDGTRLRLDPTSTLSLEPGPGKQLRLQEGRLHATVAKQPPDSPMLLTTEHATARVVGTRLALATSPGDDRLDVQEGTVAFSNGQLELLVEGGRSAQADAVHGARLLAPSSGGGAVLEVVSTQELTCALLQAEDGDTILLEPGRYALVQGLVLDAIERLTISGEDGHAGDTLLIAGPGVDTCIDVLHAVHCTLSHLTLADARQHLVFLHGEAGCQAPRLVDLTLQGATEHFIRAVGPDSLHHVDDGVVEGCRFQATRPLDPQGFTAYIDINGGARWRVSGCRFETMNFPGDAGLAGASAVLARGGASDTVVEDNRMIGCRRGVTLGVDAGVADHRGGVVRNNLIMRPAGMPGDCGIAIVSSAGTRVLFNTILLAGSYQSAIECRYPGASGILVADNLCDAGIALRDGATATQEGNCTSADASWFDHEDDGGVHLHAGASAGIPPGVAVEGGGTALGGQLRASDPAPLPGCELP